MTRLRDALNCVGFVAVLALAVALSRWGGRPVLFAPAFSGRKAVILRYLAGREFRALRSVLPKIDRHPSAFLEGVMRVACRALLPLARPERLKFAIWGYSDRSRLGLNLKETDFGVVYLEAGLLGFQERERQALVSFTQDSQAQYYDGRSPTDLEALLNGLRSGWWREDPGLVRFEAAARESSRQKYQGIDEAPAVELGPQDVLVLGQVPGDAAWTCTVSVVSDNLDLLRRAVEDFGTERRVFYKPHPFDPRSARDVAALADEGIDVQVIPARVAFRRLARMRPTVVVNTSGAGLEAAYLGCEVVAYGASYYAGWGATEDRFPPIGRRRNRLTAEDIYIAVMALYCRYFVRSEMREASLKEVTDELCPA